MLALTDVWRHDIVPLRVQGPTFSSQQQFSFVGSIQPTTEGFTPEFNRLADEGEKDYERMLLEKKDSWWQTGRSAKINAMRRIQRINVYIYARIIHCNKYAQLCVVANPNT